MPSELTRREFAESLALAALAPLLGPGTGPLALAAWEPALAAATASDPGALAKALLEVIRVQFESRLSPEDLATIARQIQSSLDRSDQIREVDLANGDEPDFVFGARPGAAS